MEDTSRNFFQQEALIFQVGRPILPAILGKWSEQFIPHPGFSERIDKVLIYLAHWHIPRGSFFRAKIGLDHV